ncbi:MULTISPECIES: tRNA 2-thiouridine(34) synthase MnmA [Holospora]|uniref:tRNA-specific 2-thiouridylase MnmA n=2 Tax=Holospora TaxID=44747 RepID=A0A061JHH4_9PROT|nr:MULTISPECIES: tRNA 2-thiouridine(34) synthase MnmA [Holospora]ETZ04743.1 tRNA-specific 2-thiouridylase MnmA [Holospora undulata HU1]GAJ46616.1 tRNA-specific 2-thiouridylase MnmA [Holospora elegans E1]
MKPRVIVGMSGGVDSTLAAALLQEQGYDVIGVTLKLYDYEQAIEDVPEAKRECHPSAFIQRAQEAAEKLQIPHYVFNKEDLFREKIINSFLDAYQKGKTPLPCAKCNRDVKTEALWNAMLQFKAQYIATGHYVQRLDTPHGAELHQGMDRRRDQSFFLFMLTFQHIQSHLFPLGKFSKEEVRFQAQSRGLKNSHVKASQDLCFMAKTSYQSWMEKEAVELHPGAIVHEDGRVLGQHKGLAYFTIGQRQGVGVGGFTDPLYVTGMDLTTHTLRVGPRESLGKNFLKLEDINWIAPDRKEDPINLHARVRSSGSLVSASFHASSKSVVLKDLEYGVAPGQACVFYEGTRILGGGWIVESSKLD